MKYDFYELRDAARAGKALPADINSYCTEKMKSLGFADAIPRIEHKQKHIHFGELTVLDVKNPARRVELTFRYGMIQYFDMIEECFLTQGQVLVVDKTRIKNPLLNTKRNREADDNG